MCVKIYGLLRNDQSQYVGSSGTFEAGEKPLANTEGELHILALYATGIKCPNKKKTISQTLLPNVELE